MKTTQCPYCGESGLAGRATYPSSLVNRRTGQQHQKSCAKWPGDRLLQAERVDPPVLESSDESERFAELEATRETEPSPTAPNGATTVSVTEDAARALIELLSRPSGVSVERVSEIALETAYRVMESQEPRRVQLQVNQQAPVELESMHRLLPRLVKYSQLKLNVMLVGPAGSGKTTAGSQAAQAMSQPYFEAGMGPHTSQWDLLGYLSPDGKYVPGKLRQSYEFGGVLFLDEIDNSNPSALVTINSAIANGQCAFPDRIVPKHPEFRLICSANTYGRGADRLYVGRQQLDAATLDRFAVIDWDYDESAELDWAGRDQQDWTKYVQRVRKAVDDLKLRVVVSPRASIMGATLLRANEQRSQVEESVLWKGISRDDRSKIEARVR